MTTPFSRFAFVFIAILFFCNIIEQDIPKDIQIGYILAAFFGWFVENLWNYINR